MELTISGLIPVAAFISYGALLSVAIWRAPRTGLNHLFSLYLICALIWGLGSFMIRADIPFQTRLLWSKLMGIGSLAMPIVFFQLVRTFLGIKEQERLFRWGLISYTVILIANLMGYVTSMVYVSEDVFRYRFGVAMPFAAFIWYTFLGLAIYNLMRQYPEVKDKFYRKKLQYLLVVAGLMGLAGFISFSFPGKHSLDIVFNTVNALIIGQVIFGSQFVDFNVVVRKGFVYLALTFFVMGVYLFIIFILGKALQGLIGYTTFLVSIAIGIIIIVFTFKPLGDLAQFFIDKLFFRERFDYYPILREFAQKITTILNLDELADSTVKMIGKTMRTKKVSLLLREGEEFQVRASTGLNKALISRIKLKKDHPLIARMAKGGEILARDSLEESEARQLQMLKGELLIPLMSKDNLVGVLMMGERLLKKAYSKEDCALLSTVAGQAAIALENAGLYMERAQLIEDLSQAKVELENWNKELEGRIKEKTEQLRRSQAQLFQSEKLAGIGQLAAGIAHEIRNPLGIIAMSLYYLKDVLSGEGKDVKRHFEIIDSEVNRCQNIINNLLDFSRKPAAEIEVIDINSLLNTTLSLVEKDLLTNDIDLIKKMEEIPGVVANVDEMKQVFLNLILNATQAMPRGGKLEVKTSTSDEKVRIEISDSGVGIPRKNLDDIFNPFFTTKEPGEGTGLGLAITHSIIEKHRGTIEVESKEGKGTTFTIELPLGGSHASGS